MLTAMEERTGVERDRQLALMADKAAELATMAEAEGKLRDAAQFWAVATFLVDCMSARSPRFRGRATQMSPQEYLRKLD